LCLDKVLDLCRFASADTERKLLSWAQRVSPAAVRRRADKAGRDKEAVMAAEQARFLRFWYFDDGHRMGLEAAFPSAQGAAIVAGLELAAKLVPALPQKSWATNLWLETSKSRRWRMRSGYSPLNRSMRTQNPTRLQ
jgi:hypothetical protein